VLNYDNRISLNELVTLQCPLVNVKMLLSGERKLHQEKLTILVDEAFAVVMMSKFAVLLKPE